MIDFNHHLHILPIVLFCLFFLFCCVWRFWANWRCSCRWTFWMGGKIIDFIIIPTNRTFFSVLLLYDILINHLAALSVALWRILSLMWIKIIGDMKYYIQQISAIDIGILAFPSNHFIWYGVSKLYLCVWFVLMNSSNACWWTVKSSESFNLKLWWLIRAKMCNHFALNAFVKHIIGFTFAMLMGIWSSLFSLHSKWMLHSCSAEWTSHISEIAPEQTILSY